MAINFIGHDHATVDILIEFLCEKTEFTVIDQERVYKIESISLCRHNTPIRPTQITNTQHFKYEK